MMNTVFNRITKFGILVCLLGLMEGFVGIGIGIFGLGYHNSDYLNNLMNMMVGIMWFIIVLGWLVMSLGVGWYFYKEKNYDNR